VNFNGSVFEFFHQLFVSDCFHFLLVFRFSGWFLTTLRAYQ
jgi:hypothetical protein